MEVLKQTDFRFRRSEECVSRQGEDVYNINDDYMVMVATDRISAFDVVLPEEYRTRGQVLNQIAEFFLDSTKDIVPNWKVAVPDPMVTVGLCCEPLKVEVIVRGYIAGSAWRDYKAGARKSAECPFPTDSAKTNVCLIRY